MNMLIDGMVEAALCAAGKILDIYDADFRVEIKGDRSPVTEADQAAEQIVAQHLTAIASDIPIVAEEAAAAGNIPPISDQFFLVDPLDGTKEFISRNGEFTVNVALIRDGLPVLGVIYAPVLGCLFAGQVGKKAWRADVPDPRVSHGLDNRRSIAVRDAGQRLDVLGSRSHCTPETDRFLEGIRLGEKKCIGSSLKFCLLASGEADLYPRLGRTMEWDTAAGDAILTAAGGLVQTLDGNRLRYGKVDQSLPFENPHFIASNHCRQVAS